MTAFAVVVAEPSSQLTREYVRWLTDLTGEQAEYICAWPAHMHGWLRSLHESCAAAFVSDKLERIAVGEGRYGIVVSHEQAGWKISLQVRQALDPVNISIPVHGRLSVLVTQPFPPRTFMHGVIVAINAYAMEHVDRDLVWTGQFGDQIQRDPFCFDRGIRRYLG